MKEETKVSTFLLVNFDNETLKEFFVFSQEEGKKVIFLSSSGGAYSACIGFLTIINSNPDDYLIRVSEYALSSGFSLIYHAKCKVEEVSSRFHMPVTYLWHSVQNLYAFPKYEAKRTIAADEMYFNEIKHALTKKQIRKHNRYVFWVKINKHFSRFLNDDIFLEREQVETLLGERLSYV